eukprot:TRINITY_DN3612_c0_g1_i3.p1 TRINITY_DN3612_c0_g1~~TRINITY_DN3612_c0_g1_i3.p1  ORF type:complete len:628 (-),score=113.17 TRINITY_DN3612_c0_g1_i3:516-2399(-)
MSDAATHELTHSLQGLSVSKGFEDITQELLAGSEDIQVGQLIHRPGFTMNEAMLSIEVMDPKMDAGMSASVCPRFEDRLENGQIPLELTKDEVLAVMDELISLEVAWLDGLPVVQTIFTCLYMHKPSIIQNKHLRVYCDALLKSCEQYKNMISLAQVYHDEDFLGHTFGFAFGEVKLAEMSGILNSLEDEDLAELKRLKKLKTDPEQNAEQVQTEITHLENILARLRFRRAIFSMNTHLDKRDGLKVDNVRKSITYALSQIPLIRQSHNSTAVPVGLIDTKINFRLLGPSPLRDIRHIPFEKALEMYEKLLRNTERCLAATTLTSLGDMRMFFSVVGAHLSDVVSRSRLALIWMPYPRSQLLFGKTPIVNLIFDELRTQGYPKALLDNASYKDFFSMAAAHIITMFRVWCQNRGRQRRKFIDLLPDWVKLQDAASAIDKANPGIHPNFQEPLAVWVAQYTTMIAHSVAYSGFDLELYHPTEMTCMSWWMEHVLRSLVHINVLVYPELSDSKNAGAAAKKKKEKTELPVHVQLTAYYAEALQFYFQAYIHVNNSLLIIEHCCCCFECENSLFASIAEHFLALIMVPLFVVRNISIVALFSCVACQFIFCSPTQNVISIEAKNHRRKME